MQKENTNLDPRLKFWLTCPHCGKRFGLLPELVLKYIDRLLDQLGTDLEDKVEREAKPDMSKERRLH